MALWCFLAHTRLTWNDNDPHTFQRQAPLRSYRRPVDVRNLGEKNGRKVMGEDEVLWAIGPLATVLPEASFGGVGLPVRQLV